MLIRGTTPTIRFSFKVLNPTNMSECYLTIKQKGELICEKNKSQAEIGSTGTGADTVNYLQWVLSQEETNMIDANGVVDIQTRTKMNDGTAYASQIYTIRGYKVLKEGVI